MLNFIQLQAAMGLGILLAFIVLCLVFVVLPILIVIFTRGELLKIKKHITEPGTRHYLLAFMTGLLYAVLGVILFGAAIFLFLYFFIDLSYC